MDIREFKNTYSSYSPSLIWDWCAKPTAQEIDTHLLEFSQMGISSVFIRPSKGLVLPYLSDDFFELIRTAARRCGKYGIELWICDENSKCSGNGGGEITSVYDYRMKSFIKTSAKDINKADVILEENGDTVTLLRDTSMVLNAKRMPLSDITDAFVTECFISLVYEEYLKQCKRFIGCEIRGFLTHINLPENEHLYSQSALKMLSGIDEKECAAALCGNNKEFESRYYSALGTCISKNFVSFLQEKCHLNDTMLYTGVGGNVLLSRQMQYIKSDCISIETDAVNPDFIELKLAQTISEQFDKPLMVRPLLGLFAAASQRYDASASFVAMGADKICYDSVAFSLSDRRKYENHTVSLSSLSEKDISDRISRFCSVCAQTKAVSNILLIYSPVYKEIFASLINRLLSLGVNFHIIDTDILKEYSSVSPDAITVGNSSYDFIIAPDSIEIPKFSGKRITPEDGCEYDFSDFRLNFTSDKEVFINRRCDENNSYIFITAKNEDTCITFPKTPESLFVADSSDGEIYKFPYNEDECNFTLKAGKTVLVILSDSICADVPPPMTDEIIITPLRARCNVEFAISAADENILPLKNVNACFGKKSYRENSIDNLHKEFYRLSDNETVKVKYPFNVSLKDVGTVRAYIENADSIDYISLNGKSLQEFTPSPKDPRFMGVDITAFLADGKNTFALEYKKSNNYTPDFSSLTPSHYYSYNITSFEPIYLCGDFDCNNNSLIPPTQYISDVSKSGMPFYYGSLTYAAKLPDNDLTGAMLKIQGNFDICRIKIGKREKVFFSETPLIEIFNLDCGTLAQITIFNTPYNLMRTSDCDAKPFGIESIELCEFDY